MSRTPAREIHEMNAKTIADKIGEFQSGLKEPELCAACRLTERAVRLAVKHGCKVGILAINEIGEVVHGVIWALDRAEVIAYVSSCDRMFDRMHGVVEGTSWKERIASGRAPYLPVCR